MSPPVNTNAAAIASLEAKVISLERSRDNLEAHTHNLPAIEHGIGRVEEHNRALYGVNGQPGIIGRMLVMETMMNDFKRVMMTVSGTVIVNIAIQILVIVFERLGGQ